jgi:hypothetical protein
MAGRVRHLFSGPASAAILLMMLAGCLLLWVGIPLGWLWVGSQVQGSASLGTALMVTMTGIVASIFVVLSLLARLNRSHARIQEARNRPTSPTGALELIMVASAGLAVVGFGVWFLVFAGTAPVPLGIGF